MSADVDIAIVGAGVVGWAAALLLPTSGVINPTVLVHKLHLFAMEYGGAYQPAAVFLDQVRAFFPGLQEDDLMPHQTGIQARKRIAELK